MAEDSCVFCEESITEVHSDERGFYNYNCPRCGKVRVTEEAALVVRNHPEIEKYKISGVLRERTEARLSILQILTTNLNMLVSGAPTSISQKINKILAHINRRSRFPGEIVSMNWHNDYPIAFAKNVQELQFLIEAIEQSSYANVRKDTGGVSLMLTPSGWDYSEGLKRQLAKPKQVFVAMWFDNSLIETYELGLKKAIEECGFEPLRVDLVHHNDKIDDRIISEIKRSAFLIADFTGNRGGVYFEAGYAMGFGLPVVWTCKASDIEAVHFDTRQYNHIVWETPEDLCQKLINRITATIL